MNTKIKIGGALCVLSAAQALHAATIDLTVASTPDKMVNGATVGQTSLPAGTGNYNPFLRIQANDSEEGYNTSSGSPAFDEKHAHTDDLNWSDLELVSLSGVDHFAFYLDINEINTPTNRTLSLTDLEVYVSNTGGQNTSTVSSLGALAWDLDMGPDGDSEILLNYDLNPGSGVDDLSVFIPSANFEAAYNTLTSPIADPFIYLYSKMDMSDDGFEEWAVREASGNLPPDPPVPPAAVPEPSLAFSLAIVVGCFFNRRRRTTQASLD